MSKRGAMQTRVSSVRAPQRRGARPSHRDIGQIALRLGGQRCAYGKQHAEPPQMIDSRTLHSMCSQFHYTMYVRA